MLDFVSSTHSINIREIQNHLNTQIGSRHYSYSTIYRVLKNEFGCRYLSLNPVHKDKNADQNKVYRRYISRLLLQSMSSDDILISIDEASFSSTTKRAHQWIMKNSVKSYRRIKKDSHKNISLVMVMSSRNVEGYIIVEGPINQVVFFTFLKNLIDSIRSRSYNYNNKVILFMDNFYAHKTPLIRSLMIETSAEVWFNSPYSPEINMIEYAFSTIKREYLQLRDSNLS